MMSVGKRWRLDCEAGYGESRTGLDLDLDLNDGDWYEWNAQAGVMTVDKSRGRHVELMSDDILKRVSFGLRTLSNQ